MSLKPPWEEQTPNLPAVQPKTIDYQPVANNSITPGEVGFVFLAVVFVVSMASFAATFDLDFFVAVLTLPLVLLITFGLALNFCADDKGNVFNWCVTLIPPFYIALGLYLTDGGYYGDRSGRYFTALYAGFVLWGWPAIGVMWLRYRWF